MWGKKKWGGAAAPRPPALRDCVHIGLASYNTAYNDDNNVFFSDIYTLDPHKADEEFLLSYDALIFAEIHSIDRLSIY